MDCRSGRRAKAALQSLLHSSRCHREASGIHIDYRWLGPSSTGSNKLLGRTLKRRISLPAIAATTAYYQDRPAEQPTRDCCRISRRVLGRIIIIITVRSRATFSTRRAVHTRLGAAAPDSLPCRYRPVHAGPAGTTIWDPGCGYRKFAGLPAGPPLCSWSSIVSGWSSPRGK
jgi:hypothetical protein